MAYEKQNLKDGQVLKAEHLAKMEQELARVKTWGDIGEVEDYLFPVTEIPLVDMDGMNGAELSMPYLMEVGKTYKVKFGDTDYDCELKSVGGEIFYLGNASAFGMEDTGEPFMLVDNRDNSMLLVAFEVTGSIPFGIYGKFVKPLDSKYLPNPYFLDFDVIGFGEVTVNSESNMDIDESIVNKVREAIERGSIKVKFQLDDLEYGSTSGYYIGIANGYVFGDMCHLCVIVNRSRILFRFRNFNDKWILECSCKTLEVTE